MRGAVTALTAEILANEPVAREHHVIVLAAPEIAAAAVPGQFAMLRVPAVYDPLLPRAFSFYRTEPDTGRIEFLYRVVGKGTRLLAAQPPGAALHIWGPLGRGFDPPTGPALLIGGGVGVPPLVHLAEHVRRHQDFGFRISDFGFGTAGSPGAGADPTAGARATKNRRPATQIRNPKSEIRNPRVEVCFGFATADLIVGADRIEALGLPLTIATDDGTRGHHGFVTDLLRQRLTQQAADAESQIRNPQSEIRNRIAVFACGPHPMLAAVARICEEFGVPSQLALEAPMACGVGACIGCTVPRRSGGYARVCTDGPVFPAEEIAWPPPTRKSETADERR